MSVEKLELHDSGPCSVDGRLQPRALPRLARRIRIVRFGLQVEEDEDALLLLGDVYLEDVTSDWSPRSEIFIIWLVTLMTRARIRDG